MRETVSKLGGAIRVALLAGGTVAYIARHLSLRSCARQSRPPPRNSGLFCMPLGQDLVGPIFEYQRSSVHCLSCAGSPRVFLNPHSASSRQRNPPSQAQTPKVTVAYGVLPSRPLCIPTVLYSKPGMSDTNMSGNTVDSRMEQARSSDHLVYWKYEPSLTARAEHVVNKI
ncbi:hypothetical protein R1flu_018080 [Riccia fluitans]|uniref:Uncharacterized protein n=1 Tax=Riccia fluitans TaxID=41844 RepID=A0ABD1ZES7_9MARC